MKVTKIAFVVEVIDKGSALAWSYCYTRAEAVTAQRRWQREYPAHVVRIRSA